SQDSASLVGYVSVELDRGRERGSQYGQGFLEQRLESDRRALCHGLATEREELLHQLFGAFARDEHFTEAVPGGTGLWHIVGCTVSKNEGRGPGIILNVGENASPR